MKQELAVEWFAKRISHGGLVSKKQFDELLEQAKAIEEDGKHESYLYGHEVGYKKAKEFWETSKKVAENRPILKKQEQ